ncbi:MAG: hypothetical protein ACFFGZ_20295 [Candidatus Thorarchaeota archaeon]
MASITLEAIYNGLLEIKKRVQRLEQLLILPEEELPDSEIEELRQISQQMKDEEKILGKKE